MYYLLEARCDEFFLKAYFHHPFTFLFLPYFIFYLLDF